ncbi:hypothetical protein [Rathayibacter soli]|uniref:hypothetical protein n=1 Tax=Rathayibacter soli TaxID=3144168 RepID=UPI0027E4177C|nr:hypothetical protein [Glaciibacter superstes]
MVLKRLRRTATWLLVLFAVQFAFGMTLNLFVTLPKTHPGATGGEYFSRSAASLVWALTFGGGSVLFLHALLGAVLFVGTLALFIVSLRRDGRGWRWASGIALFFTFAAFFNGMSFVDYNEDFSSAIMAGCWLIAVVALVVALVRAPAAASAPASAGAAAADAAADS